MVNFREFYEVFLEGGAAGHMAHPFNLPQVKTGNDLIELFNKTAQSLNTNPGAIKIDGVNASIKLINKVDGGKEFALDRGSMKPLDVEGIRIDDLVERFGEGHGMVETGTNVLKIFNSAIPSIEGELKSNEIKFKQGALNKLIDKLNPIAAEHGFKVLGSVDTQLEGEVDFSSALQERITIKYNDDKEETRTLQGWLADAKNPFKQVVNLAGGGKDTAMTKKMYFAVMNGQNLLDIVDEKDVGWVVSGAVMYHATRTLGNVLLAAVNSEIGTADTQEGIVIRDKNIAKVPYKITGEFIVRGMESQFRQA